MSPENRRANIAEELAASRQAREAAARNAAAGDLKTAVNRLYYAVFHLARAVCLSEGIEPRRHRALNRLLRIHFVQAGRLAEWTVQTLSRLENDRDLADYVAAFQIDTARYQEREQEADRVLAELEAYLRGGGWLS